MRILFMTYVKNICLFLYESKPESQKIGEKERNYEYAKNLQKLFRMTFLHIIHCF